MIATMRGAILRLTKVVIVNIAVEERIFKLEQEIKELRKVGIGIDSKYHPLYLIGKAAIKKLIERIEIGEDKPCAR